MTYRTTSVLAFALLAASLAAPATAADNDDKNLANYTCKEVMLFSGKDRDVAIAVLHGYLLGKSGGTTFNTDVLAAGTDRFMDYCLDNPTRKALESMEKVMKAPAS
ncbi:HdeA/HdeB family chaperone [Dokdonella sp.]|uniref:HdeA/HdeB family chaperone n=1 Tax=Dokdonella sp. TaxID=2291710 RepID=UPI0035286A22